MKEKMYFYLDPDDRKWTMEDLGISFDNLRYEDLKMNTSTLEGTYLMKDGEVIKKEELDLHCISCMTILAYNEEHDSKYCSSCDEWREDQCSDPACEYCAARPEKPSSCEEEF